MAGTPSQRSPATHGGDVLLVFGIRCELRIARRVTCVPNRLDPNFDQRVQDDALTHVADGGQQVVACEELAFAGLGKDFFQRLDVLLGQRYLTTPHHGR